MQFNNKEDVNLYGVQPNSGFKMYGYVFQIRLYIRTV